MLSELSGHVDPFRLCDQARSFEGRVEVADLPRLVGAVASPEGQVSYRIDCDRDDRRRARIRGSVDAELALICQRCMGVMHQPVHADFQLAVVGGEAEAAQLPEEYDPLLLQDETVSLAAVIEDELLLALPIAPVHPVAECSEDPADWVLTDREPETAPERENPFAVLADIKPRQTDD